MISRNISALAALCLLVCLALTLMGLCVGSSGFENSISVLLDDHADAQTRALAQQIVWNIRLPRTLGALAAGALLGLAGALAQGLFRNPLADPYLLGSASGATLGVALALAGMGGGAGMLGASMMADADAVGVFSSSIAVRMGLTGAAFAGATVAVAVTLTLARGVQHTLRLLLAGVIVGVVFGAVTSVVLLLSPESLQAMQAFLLGSTSFIGWTSSVLMLLVWLVCVAAAWALSRVLDGMSLGELTARSLGLPIGSLRTALLVILALATGTAVAQTGLIAFVGLAAPHLVRAWVKVPHRQLMWLASAVGAVLLGSADLLARWLIAPQELPVGVLTAVLGGAYLLWLMQRRVHGLASRISP
jgi:iron complex transport system permease protein